MSVSGSVVNLCVGYGLVVIIVLSLTVILGLWVRGLTFLYHAIYLMSLWSLSHDCKWCF